MKTSAPVFFGGNQVISSEGKFQIRPNTLDGVIVSPGYERADKAYCFSLLKNLLSRGEPVGFIDVGANIGGITIPVAQRIHSNQLHLWAVEPVPENMALLRFNLMLNGIAEDKVTLVPYAISNQQGIGQMSFDPIFGGDAKITKQDKETKNQIKISLKSGQEIFTELPDTLVIKIDVEGHEIQVLDGLRKVISDKDCVWIWIEDAFRVNIYQHLANMGFKAVTKRSPDSSWWQISK